MKIPKTHREPAPHKMPSGATCGPRAACLRPLVYMVVKLHAHWNKHLLNAKFSYREHYWWLTSQTCVNTLINETSVKWIATSQIDRGKNSINLIYCYSSRRATQNMSATRNSPTIGLNLRALLLSAVTVSLHYLPRCLHSIVTCGKTSTTATWSASSKICCHVIVTQQRP